MKNRSKNLVIIIALSAVALALNIALSYLKLGTLPQGGSITFASMLPLFLCFHIIGMPWSLTVGFTAGLLQFLLDGVVWHWGSIFLDYLVPFTLLGLCAIFKNKKRNTSSFRFIFSIIFCSILRYASHVLSGAILFSEYAGSQNPWIYSMTYNSFVFVDMAICLVIAISFCLNKNFRILLNKKV